MSDEIATGESLDDFLVNLANGLSQAQNQLNRAPVKNALGEDASVYYIPKMEFELHLNMTTTRSGGTPRLQFLPIKQSVTTKESASSVIRGVMVATPVGDGLPGISLSITARKRSARKIDIELIALQQNDDPLVGQEVEINLDRELSNELNKKEGRSKTLSPSTKLQQNVLTLDDSGSATTELSIANNEPTGQLFALVGEVSGKTQTLLYRFS